MVDTIFFTDNPLCQQNNVNNCDERAICSDTAGGFTCTCKDGYAGSGVEGDCPGRNSE